MENPVDKWQPLGANEFRLLKIHRQLDRAATYELSVQAIDKPPPFAAISYVCGEKIAEQPFQLRRAHAEDEKRLNSDGAEAQRVSASADSFWTLQIPANLESAIHLFARSRLDGRSHLAHDYFWVDAICINQIDSMEKAAQVASMHKIYHGASEVVVCLGEEEDHSSEVIGHLREVVNIMENPVDALLPDLTALFESMRFENGRVSIAGARSEESNAVLQSFVSAAPKLADLIKNSNTELAKYDGGFFTDSAAVGSGAAEEIRRRFISIENVHALSRALISGRRVSQTKTEFEGRNLPSLDDAFWPALTKLCSRPWFHRLWTYQEAVLARKCVVMCGSQTMDWTDLLRIVEALLNTQLMWVTPSDMGMSTHIMSKALDVFQVAEIGSFSAIHTKLPDDLLQLYTSVSSQSKYRSAIPSIPRLETSKLFPYIFDIMRARDVKEPRDRIYAILSLAPPEVRSLINVDYNIPLPQLYVGFTKALLCNYPYSQVFNMVSKTTQTPGLPSWCPDYNLLPSYTMIPTGAVPTNKWQMWWGEPLRQPHMIYVSGAKVDTVTAVIQNFDFSRRRAANACGPDGEAAGILRWLDACWSLVQERVAADTDEAERIFISAILAEVPSKQQQDPPYPQDAVEGFRELKKLLQAMRSSSSEATITVDERLAQPIWHRLWTTWHNQVFFATEGGHFGIAAQRAQVSDHIFVLYGDSQMFLLRPLGTYTYEFISIAHVTEFSDGKGFDDLPPTWGGMSNALAIV